MDAKPADIEGWLLADIEGRLLCSFTLGTWSGTQDHSAPFDAFALTLRVVLSRTQVHTDTAQGSRCSNLLYCYSLNVCMLKVLAQPTTACTELSHSNLSSCLFSAPQALRYLCSLLPSSFMPSFLLHPPEFWLLNTQTLRSLSLVLHSIICDEASEANIDGISFFFF